jgi:hypothetical protein
MGRKNKPDETPGLMDGPIEWNTNAATPKLLGYKTEDERETGYTFFIQ